MPDKINIIFVDDESNILDGLRRMLWGMRKEWTMSFASGGQSALDMLAAQSYDVIVSDIRMPGINGVQLLNEVKRGYPHMVRIALSGQTSREAILRSVGPVHQYISKPSEAQVIINSVKRVCSYRNFLTEDRFRSLAARLESLPCLSSCYTALKQKLHERNASMESISEIVAQDAAIAVKILQLVNSAFFGVRQHVTSIYEAVKYLGLDTIRALVLTVKIFNQFDEAVLPGFSLPALWEHSYTVGEWAQIIARAEDVGAEIAADVFLSGLLHDIGKLVLASTLPRKYQEVLTETRAKGCAISEAEAEIIGVTHAEVGAYLLGLWGFSNSIIEVLLYHHQPIRAPVQAFNALTAVYIADRLHHRRDSTGDGVEDLRPSEDEYLKVFKVARKIPLWRKMCRDHTGTKRPKEEASK